MYIGSWKKKFLDHPSCSTFTVLLVIFGEELSCPGGLKYASTIQVTSSWGNRLINDAKPADKTWKYKIISKVAYESFSDIFISSTFLLYIHWSILQVLYIFLIISPNTESAILDFINHIVSGFLRKEGHFWNLLSCIRVRPLFIKNSVLCLKNSMPYIVNWIFLTSQLGT